MVWFPTPSCLIVLGQTNEPWATSHCRSAPSIAPSGSTHFETLCQTYLRFKSTIFVQRFYHLMCVERIERQIFKRQVLFYFKKIKLEHIPSVNSFCYSFWKLWISWYNCHWVKCSLCHFKHWYRLLAHALIPTTPNPKDKPENLQGDFRESVYSCRKTLKVNISEVQILGMAVQSQRKRKGA